MYHRYKDHQVRGEISRREKQAPSQTQSLLGRKKLLLPLVIQREKEKGMNRQKTEERLMDKSFSRETYSSTSVFCTGFMKVGWNFAELTLEKNLNGLQRSRTLPLHYLVTLSTIKISAHHSDSRGSWGRFFTTSPRAAKEKLKERSQSLAARVTQKIP